VSVPLVWMARLDLVTATRPGILARIAQVFAERGISLQQVLAAGQHGRPTVLLTFAASARLRDYLARRLRRMPEIAGVAIEDGAGRSLADLAAKPETRPGW
jgi:hypothetical protein